MSFKVDNFISNFDRHSGYARVSKFEVKIAQPPIKIQGANIEDLTLQCESTELPGYTINTVESKIFGASTFVAAGASYGDITLNFICAGDFWEKKFFDSWMETIIPKTSYLLGYKEEYQTTIDIIQFADYSKGEDEFGQQDIPIKIFTCKLLNAYPVNVAALQLNWSGDDIHRLAVTFKYDRWKNAEQQDIKVSSGPLDKVQKYSGVTPPKLPVSSSGGFIGGGGKFGGGGASGGW